MARATTSISAVQRARKYREYFGRKVTIKLRAFDVATTKKPDPIVMTGEVLALAKRIKGRADWAGDQYDMVLGGDDLTIYVFALSRIESIEMVT